MAATAFTPAPLFRRPEIRFPVRFLALGIAFALAWGVLQPTWTWLCSVTAAIVVWLADVVGLQAAAEPGAHVRFADGDDVFRYVIEDGCTAVLLVATYAIAVIAYPTDRRSRVLGVIAGIPVLLVVNVLRLVSLGWVGLHLRASFDAIHMFWWQVFFVTGTGVLWFAWVWWTSDARALLPARRSVTLPKPSTTVLLVVGQLLAFSVLGLWAHGADLYFRLLNIPTAVFAGAFWGGQAVVSEPGNETAFGTYLTSYAQLAAVIALFLASPGIDVRSRLRGVLRWVLPSMVALHVVELLWLSAVRLYSSEDAVDLWQRAATIEFVLSFILYVGVSLVVWQVWFQRERDRAMRKALKATGRRGRNRHLRR